MKYLMVVALLAALVAGCDQPAEGCDACFSSTAVVAHAPTVSAVAAVPFVQSHVVAVPQVTTTFVHQPVVQSVAIAHPVAVASVAHPVAVASVGCGVQANSFAVRSCGVRSASVRSRSVARSSSGGVFGLGFLGGSRSRAVAVSR